MSGPGATRVGNVQLSRGVHVCVVVVVTVSTHKKKMWQKDEEYHSFLSGLPRQYLRWPYAA